jgi:hypothetical protein
LLNRRLSRQVTELESGPDQRKPAGTTLVLTLCSMSVLNKQIDAERGLLV